MWIIDLLDKLTCFLPRLWRVEPDEAGVRTTPKWPWSGMWVRMLEPGAYWYVPLWQTCRGVQVKTQVVDARGQSIFTADGKDVTISGSVRYRIRDAVKAILEVQDYDRSIVVLMLGIIHRFVRSRTLEEVKSGLDELEGEILKQLRKESQGWGLWIEQVYLTDTGNVLNLRVLTAMATVTNSAGEVV